MRYISTRGTAPPLDFESVLLAGLASDGGLYVPEIWPSIGEDEIALLAGLNYEETAFKIMAPFIGGAFSDREFRTLIDLAYSEFGHPERCPLIHLGQDSYLLELFHGPTLAFKDFAMQLVGRMFESVLKRRNERVTIIGATSGDTGSAAIEAFKGLDSVDVFILFPHGRVSDVQRRQMTTPGEENVHAIALEGDFDDCQARVKDMFNDPSFREKKRLAGVNSINWARIMAQIVYYFVAASRLGAPGRQVSFTVPTGNFGDIYAGFAARTMGLGVNRLIVATNQNDILHRALTTGEYRVSEVTASHSPSMDIQVSSNFERALFEAYGRDSREVTRTMSQMGVDGFSIREDALEQLRESFESGRCSEQETLATIAEVHRVSGRIVCPHTAVGLKVAAEAAKQSSGEPMITLATAHPAKFPESVQEACKVSIELPKHMSGLNERPERMLQVPNELAAVQDAIRQRSRL